MFDERNRVVIEDYQKKPPFSSFLPGIAGPMGIPMWCFYNNRGQGICSFGAKDKDHAILEFSPAHVAYRDNSRTGFRTFAKINGRLEELFTGDCRMYIGMSELEISERNDVLEASVLYYGVPEERAALLARVLSVTNTGSTALDLELLDGLPAVVPYGVNQDRLKNMTQLAKAWMQVEDTKEGLAYFRVRASMDDTARVTEVKGGNFCLAWDGEGKLLRPLVQPSLIFDENTSLSSPDNFAAYSLRELCAAEQRTENIFPCCFMPVSATLQPGETAHIYSLYGQAEKKGIVPYIAARAAMPEWFEEKRRRAFGLIEELCHKIKVRTSNPVFDAYCGQTYLDNLLRGGTPMFFESNGKKVPFYIYSRKHGDPEREYNYFSVGGEYYAQGNANYRDVNQNRRCDVLFEPQLEEENIHTFFDLIQTDGYNPLVLTAAVYTLPEEKKKMFISRLPKAAELFDKGFTPGELAMAAEAAGLSGQEVQQLVAEIICAAESCPCADFSEGYWCDHWTYNLDLIESYLMVFPEKEGALLFDNCRYRWYESRILVNPRTKRYVWTEDGLRQYHALDETARAEKKTGKWMCTADGKEARSTLIEKLLLLCAIKTATLDAAGYGVEMEGGKPGWYDALNGLPGLLGSSMAESCELARLLRFTAGALKKRGGEIAVYSEIANLLEGVEKILRETGDLRACSFQQEDAVWIRWDRMNCMKEAYRKATLRGYAGERRYLSCSEMAGYLRRMEATVMDGIRRAESCADGICPTYFTFTAMQVRDTPDGPLPVELTPCALPLFLEGPVHRMKLDASKEEKLAMVQQIQNSCLYDRKLQMYKVNADLGELSFEAGRAKAFTPGWLENESVWLHMEYKFLLEILKSGLYDKFAEAFHKAVVPFMDEKKYGRSLLENVSFIASSANPDASIHGRGFVARLSGSTAEFLQMWQIMFFGRRPFLFQNGKLCLAFTPFVPEYLMPEDGVVEAMFLGHILVIYHADGCSELIPEQTTAVRYVITGMDGKEEAVDGAYLPERLAKAVRNGEISKIDVTMRHMMTEEK